MPETDPPIWEVLARLAAELPAEEAAKLPANLAATIGHEWQRITALEAMVAEREAALHALVAKDPESGGRWDEPERPPECHFCRHFSAETPWQLTHAPDCPWVRARELLACWLKRREMARKVRVSGYARVTRKPGGTVVVTTVKPYRRAKPTMQRAVVPSEATERRLLRSGPEGAEGLRRAASSRSLAGERRKRDEGVAAHPH